MTIKNRAAPTTVQTTSHCLGGIPLGDDQATPGKLHGA